MGFPSTWWRTEQAWRQDVSLQLLANAELEYDFPEVPATPRPPSALIPGTPSATAIPTLEQPLAPAVDAGALYPTQHELPPEPMADLDSVTEEVPNRNQKAAIMRCHVNLGHPPLNTLLRAMRQANIRPGIRAWCKRHFHCEACRAWRPAASRRPAAIPHSFAFNVTVGCDTVFLQVASCSTVPYMNIVCWGTRFVPFVRLQTEHDAPTAASSLAAFEQGWARIFGLPCTVVTDQGSEYKEPFTTKLQAEGVEHVVIASRAPWEQASSLGRRDGRHQVEQLVAYSCMARNAQFDRSGSTPSQRVFGQLPRFPADLQSDAQVDADILALDSRGDHRRAQEIRESARLAFQKTSMATRLQRAARAQTVSQPPFSSGDLVFVMRQNAMRRQWREGLGRVIAVSGAAAFVAIRGELYKISTLALKKATGE
eukprot:2967253-Amphidinium_carterae.1